MTSTNLNMLHSLKPFLCPKCSSAFSGRDAARYNVKRFPRILTCYHSACESCLHAASNNNTFSCPVCQEEIDLSDSDEVTKFPPDVHALGVISVNMKNSLPSLKLKTSKFSCKRNQQSLKKLVSITCGHCNKNDALWQCDECQLNFCSICFGDVHGDMKSKKKHEGKKIFAELYNSMVQEGCSEHENKAVEFYCEVDNQLTCSYCMLMGDHVGHEVKTLLDKNKSCADGLRNVLEDVTKMQRQLKYTDHLLCKAIPKEKIDTSDLMKEIHDYFHKLHAMLQMRESELINELIDISESNIKPLEEMRLKVTGHERELASGKKDAASVIENPCLAISAPALLKKLEGCKDLPCHLVPVTDSDVNTKFFNIELVWNSELENHIKQVGQLKCNISQKYILKAGNDLPENFSPPEIPETFDNASQDAVFATEDFQDSLNFTGGTESCATSVDNFSEDSLSIGSTFSSTQATFRAKDYTKMQPEKVSVTHIESPSSFYVQGSSDSRKLQNMSEAMDRYCKNYEGKKNKPTEVIPGDLYLVKYSFDNRWYRGRVKTVLDPENAYDGDMVIGKRIPMVTDGGRVVVKNKEALVEVFYIDFGNSETVSIQNMRNILPRFLHVPSLAKKCSLVDINPIEGKEWNEECTKTFAKFVQNKVVIMQVYEERNNVFFVDLCQIADNDIPCDTPVSVRDALVFSELAVFTTGVTVLSTSKRKNNLRSYMPPESLGVNANIWSIVSHAEDPDNLYVQQISTSSYLSNLTFEMNEAYNKDMNQMLHNIYVPYIGMICAAQFSLDKQWYRAQVIGLPGGAKVEVCFVDFGNKEVIHHKRLRKLFDRFSKLNIQAMPCKLAHVSYNQEKCWSSEAKEWLTNEVSRKQLTVKSLGTIPGINKAEVVLYYSDDEFDVCVNSLMVQKRLATATGPFGSTEVKVRKSIPPPMQGQERKTITIGFNQMPENIVPPVPAYDNTVTLPSESPPPVTKSNNPLVEASPPKKYPTLATPPVKTPESVEVHVSHVENPGCFYIRTVRDSETKYNSLMQEMQKTYENLLEEIIDCSVSKSYAVFSQIQKKWLRGSVLSKKSDNTFEIHFDDYGNTEEIQKKDIRKLTDKFSRDPAFSVRCHLDGIIPAGGSSQWPQTACDSFKRGVDLNETLLLCFKGEADKETNSLPADLLIENLIRGGALEPTKLEYISLAAELIKNGLALPIRKKCGSPSGLHIQETSEPQKEVLNWATRVEEEELKSKIMEKENVVELFKEDHVVENGCSHTPPPVIKSPKPAVPKFQWKPAIPPLESSFRAIVTNIGEDGNIHLYSLNEGCGQVDVIKKALQFKFAKSSYDSLQEPPPIGEACLAKFSVDNMWYRAEVISAYPGQVKVHFVDYGNNEIINLKDIRPELLMQTIPRQCLECTLFGVNDKIAWDTELLSFLHGQLVENEVLVEIKGPAEEGRLPCVIKMLSGIDIGDLLLSLGFCAMDPEEIKLLSASQTELDTFKTFSSPKEWREGDVFPVCITHVPSPNIVYLQKLKIPNPKDEYEKEHNQQYESFLELIAELRKRADSFPKLKEPLPGMPCCAKYSYDKDWYRCEITDLTENGAVVLYVDYGNTETVSSDDLKELESSFIEFPVQLHFCKLHGMLPAGEEWGPSVHDILIKKFLIPDQNFVAKVVMPGKMSHVDILSQVDGEYKLVYEDLAKDNLVILDK